MNANLTHGHSLCLHCEELVHPYASHCPYCQKPVTAQSTTSATSLQASIESLGKIAPINPFEQIEQKQIDAKNQQPEAVDATFASHVAHVILALFTLLAGSFFFFFGLLVLMFSQNGVFRLEWNVSSWPYFVFSAVTLLIIGLWSLSKVEK
jgi:hypothetical protein